VAGFKMDILEDGKFVTDSTLVYLKDIKYSLPDKSLKIEPIFRLFIGRMRKDQQPGNDMIQ
jgi:hypothetical protein